MVGNSLENSIGLNGLIHQRDFEVITPEMIDNRKSAFLKAISVGKTPEEKLRLGTQQMLGDLLDRYEGVSVDRLCGEIKCMLSILYCDGADVKAGININNYFMILSSRKQCFALFGQWKILERVQCYSKDIVDRVDLGEFQDSLDLQEGLGKILSELPRTKQLILTANKPVVFGELDQCERGLVGLLLLKGRPTVIKFTNSDEETEVATFCGKKGLSPLVYESTPNCIAEEFINVPQANSFKSNPEIVGQVIGAMVKKLHQEGIVYDNRFLDHVCVEFIDKEHKKFRTRIIDLESATFSDDFKVDVKNAASELQRFYKNDENAFKSAINTFNERYYKKQT